MNKKVTTIPTKRYEVVVEQIGKAKTGHKLFGELVLLVDEVNKVQAKKIALEMCKGILGIKFKVFKIEEA